MTKIIYLSNRVCSNNVNGNLALKKNFNVNQKKTFEAPKIFTLKIKNNNKLYCLCWQLGGDSDC